MSRAASAAALALAALAVQGCAAIPVVAAVGVMGAVPDGGPDRRRPGPAAQSPRDAGTLPGLGVLPPQTLAPGACALFLFTQAEPSRFAAFAPADGAALILSLDGETRSLAAAASPTAAPDAFSQIYGGEDGLEARLAATLGDPLPQGRRIPAASLRLSVPGGAAQVTPLAGLLACEAAP